MKIAVVVDSNSGVTQAEAERLGLFVLPMPFMIDGQIYLEGVDLTQEEFYRRMEAGADITTSQPTPESVTALWDRLLGEYDQVVHIPMSSGLSGSCQTAMVLAQEYESRVWVVDNHRISVTQRQSALEARDLAAKGYSGQEIREILERSGGDSIIYITVDTLKYLKKGGRITPAAAALGTLLRIKPVLQIAGEKLDAFSKVRTMKQAKTAMLTALAKDLAGFLGDPDGTDSYFQVAHTCNDAMAREMKEMLAQLYPGKPVVAAPLSLSIACHIGPGSLAVACTRQLKELA